MSHRDQGTVFLIDDDEFVRQSFAAVFDSIALHTVVYETGSDFLDEEFENIEGVVVLDMCMPGINGIELLEVIQRRYPHVPCIIITGHGDVATAVRAMKVGAFDFLEKPVSMPAILDTVRKAMRHGRELGLKARRRADVAERLRRLSAREREVLDLIVQGQQSKEIASRLGISPFTVDNHRSRIMAKMQTRSVADLVRQVIQTY